MHSSGSPVSSCAESDFFDGRKNAIPVLAENPIGMEQYADRRRAGRHPRRRGIDSGLRTENRSKSQAAVRGFEVPERDEAVPRAKEPTISLDMLHSAGQDRVPTTRERRVMEGDAHGDFMGRRFDKGALDMNN